MSKRLMLISFAAMLILTIALSGCGGTEHTLSIVVQGQGVVTPKPGGTYKSGTIVELTKAPAAGYAFDHWDGPDGESVQENKIRMDGNKVIVAVFTKLKYNLTVNISPVGAGTVDAAIAMQVKSAYDTDHGQAVRLEAKPNPGYVFDHWEANDISNPKNIIMGEDKTITAHFVPVLKGRVFGVHTLNPFADVTAHFSDGGTAVTDANGYWVKKYDPASPPSGSVTVTPGVEGYCWKSYAPALIRVSWPAREIIFSFEAYRFVAKWGSVGGGGSGQFMHPEAMAIDAEGNIYIADTTNNRIQKFASDGTYLLEWGSFGSEDGQFRSPQGIAVDAKGFVYVVDSFRIQIFKSNGEFQAQWGSKGNEDNQLFDPTDVAVDAEENVYIVDHLAHCIKKFAGDGVFLKKIGSAGIGDGQLVFPVGIALDAAGNIYVTDSNNNRIQKFTKDGTFLAKWDTQSSGNGQPVCPYRIALDAAGNIYITDNANHLVQKYAGYGVLLAEWSTTGISDNQSINPMGVVVDATGHVYLTDKDNHCVRKFEYLD